MSLYPYGGYGYPLTQSVPYAPTYAPQLAQSVLRPVPVQPSVVQPVQYVQPQPVQYVPQPVQYAPQPVQYVQPQPVAVAPVQPTIKGESRVEYVEYERPEIEYVTEYQPVQVAKTKYVKDTYPVEYQTEYIPRTVYETQTEYVPVTKTVPRIEYDAVERQVVPQPPPVEVVPQPVPVVQQVVPQPVQYVPQPVVQQVPLTYSVAAPVQYAAPVQGYVAPITQSYVRNAPYYPPQGSHRPHSHRPDSSKPTNQAQTYQKKK